MDQYEAIVIGAGLGGLTAGAKLAKEGKQVLLIEQHNKVGGCATTFKRKGRTFEVGLHEMDGLKNKNDFKIKLFQELGVFDNVEFIQVPEFYRFKKGDIDIVVPHGITKAIETFTKAFPNEEKAIKTFFLDDLPVFSQGNMERIVKFAMTSVGDYLDDLTTNESLKFALTGNIGYYHDDPYSLSLIVFLGAQYSYFTGGGHFIKGGSQSLSDYLAKVITDNGGDVILNHLVTEILVEDDTAIGVKYSRKRSKANSNEEKESFGKVIIANAAIPNVVNKLLGDRMKDTEYLNMINSLELPCSLFSIYLSFSQPPSTVGSKHYSIFILSDKVNSLKEVISIEKSGDHSKKGFTFTDYSSIDSKLSEKGYIGVICGIDYLENWINLDEDEYKKKKEELIEIYLDRFDEVFPGIKGIIDYAELGTARTMVSYTQNPAGSAYGFAQTVPQVNPQLRAQIRNIPVKNLFFASAWASSGGFSGAISTGNKCANKILKDYL
ncbi:MAG: phytoene desaturase family protein [Candidatus Kariarchaeaceae archaeon]|jgi:phytoene dehydrogenase-like protein